MTKPCRVGAPLSPREKEVVELMVLGKTNAEIGIVLGIAQVTAKNHVEHVMAKLGACNRTLAVAKYLVPERFVAPAPAP